MAETVTINRAPVLTLWGAVAVVTAISSVATAQVDLVPFYGPPPEAISSDGRFVAVMEWPKVFLDKGEFRRDPHGDLTPKKLSVFEVQGDQREFVWSCDMTDGSPPTELHVAADGATVMVLRDSPPEATASGTLEVWKEEGMFWGQPFEEVFGVTRDEFYQLQWRWEWPLAPIWAIRGDEQPLLCLWTDVPAEPAWLCFEMVTGMKVDPDEALTEQLRAVAGATVDEWLVSTEAFDHITAIRYLVAYPTEAHQALLTRESESSLLTWRPFTSNRTGQIWFECGSWVRRAAAAALARLEDPAQERTSDRELAAAYFGRIDLTVQLPADLPLDESGLWVCVAPEDALPGHWPPEITERTFHFHGLQGQGDLNAINVMLKDVVPGRYSVWVWWDLADPFVEHGYTPLPSIGDYVTEPTPVFNVAGGEVVQLGQLACDRLVTEDATVAAEGPDDEE